MNPEHPGARYAIALNDETPRIVNIDADEYSKAWSANVLRATAFGTSSHTVETPGHEILRVWMVDPEVVLDKFDFQVGYQRGGEFEAEDLQVAGTSGRKFRLFTDEAASGGVAVVLGAVNPGDSVTLAQPGLQAGEYDLGLRVKEMNNRGKMRMAVANAPGGPNQELGDELDLYSASEAYRELAATRLKVVSPGTKYLKFSVAGRHSANHSGPSWIALDRLKLIPTEARK